MSDLLNVVCGVIPKNSREEVRVGLQEYKGTQYVDLRIYAEVTSNSNARSPTKQGFTVSFANLAALRFAVDEAYREAEERGLLP